MNTASNLERQLCEERLAILRINQQRLELKRAQYGSINTPLEVMNEIDRNALEIAQVEEQLRQLSAVAIPLLPTPNNLPRSMGGFVGRTAELTELSEKMSDGWPIVCLEGIGGIGKTSLALEWAQQALEKKTFIGIIWLSSSQNHALVLGEALDTIARTLEHEKLIHLAQNEKMAAVQKLLRSERYLIVADSFETIDDEDLTVFLSDVPNPSKVLVTITGKHFPSSSAWLIELKGLSSQDTLQLIRQEAARLGLEPLEKASKSVLLRLYQTTDGMPLAIKWSLGQIRQRGQSLERVLANLSQAKGDLFETIFGRSFGLLTINAAQVLRALVFFPAPASAAALAGLTKIEDVDILESALEQLTEMLLVDVSDILSEWGAHYSLHSLTRAYAQRELEGKSELTKDMAFSHLAAYFLGYVRESTSDADYIRRYQALDMENENILSVLKWCYEIGASLETERIDVWKMFVEMVDRLADYHWARGYFSERIELCKKAFEVCRWLGDTDGAGRQAYNLGWVFWEQGNTEQAWTWAQECQGVVEQTNQPASVSLAKHLLGLVAMRRSDYAASETYFREALALTPSERHGVGGKASIMCELGHLFRVQGKFVDAKGWYERCIIENTNEGFSEGLSIDKGYLAQTLALMGQKEQAETLYLEALPMAINAGRSTTIARIHTGLAELLIDKGQLAEALEHIQAAIPIYKRLEKVSELEKVQAMLNQVESRAT